MFLIAGLGNVGDKYTNTRHNVGFIVIDNMVKNLTPTKINKINFQAELFKNKNQLLAKPTTFMNESGQSINAITKYYNIDNKNIIIIHDDLDIPFGAVKFKLGGGDAGHNGLKSIDSYIGSDYTRIRIGIGRPDTKIEISKWVLSRFTNEEISELNNNIIQHITYSIEAMDKFSLNEIKSRFSKKGNL